MTWIKICGTTNLEDALAAAEAGADALGFVFAPSPRRISPRDAARIITALPVSVEKIGVFVNQSLELVLDTVHKAGLTGVQLHGEEDGRFARRLQEEHGSGQLRVIKVVAMGEVGQGKGKGLAIAAQEDAAKMFSALLLDSGGSGKRGGSGALFDWQEAAPLARLLAKRVALIIAGGLNPDNVAKALRTFHPWGVDVVSGVEQAPGKKDIEKVRMFVAAVRQFEAGPAQPPPEKAATRE
jgi:phosphoribosylanthranilate isomerase